MGGGEPVGVVQPDSETPQAAARPWPGCGWRIMLRALGRRLHSATAAPDSVSLHPPQAALDSAAPKRGAFWVGNHL